MIKSFSLATVVVLVMVGCNSGSKDGDKEVSFVSKNNKASSISAVKSINNTTINSKSVKSIEDSAKSTYEKRDNGTSGNVDALCQSGTMDVHEDSVGNGTFSIDAKNCVQGNSRINGAFSMKVSDDEKSASAEVTRRLNVEEGSDSFTVEQGSKFTMADNAIYADFKATLNGELLAANNIKATFVTNGENEEISFSSGALNIAGYYFEFVSQDVPFSGEETLDKGHLTLKDGAGHKVVVSVESPDNIALKIDENNDGDFSEAEIFRIDLAETLGGGSATETVSESEEVTLSKN